MSWSIETAGSCEAVKQHMIAEHDRLKTYNTDPDSLKVYDAARDLTTRILDAQVMNEDEIVVVRSHGHVDRRSGNATVEVRRVHVADDPLRKA